MKTTKATHKAWSEAGKRLRAVDPPHFARLLELAAAYVANHERELESDNDFAARCAAIEAHERSRGPAN